MSKSPHSSLEIKGLNDVFSDILKEEGIIVTQDLKNAVKDFSNKFDAAWRAQLNKADVSKVAKSKEPTAQMYSYDEDMNTFIMPWEKQLNTNIEKYGEGLRLIASYLSLKGIGDVKRMNLLYKHTFYNPQVYDAYMKAWETIFFANDPNTGLNLMDSVRAKSTAARRVPDVTNLEGRCID